MGTSQSRSNTATTKKITYESNKHSENFIKPPKEGESVRKGNPSKSPSKGKHSEYKASQLDSASVSNVKSSHFRSKTSRYVETLGKPQITLVFESMSFRGKQVDFPVDNYVAVNKVLGSIEEPVGRGLDYSEETKLAYKSEIVMSNNLMNYDLDEEGGVAWTSEIPTFFYETQLSHDHFYRNRNEKENVQTITPSRIRSQWKKSQSSGLQAQQQIV